MPESNPLTLHPLNGEDSMNDNIWFYRPSWYWHGWSTLSPIHRGHDEHARWTLMLGWTITGRIIIALNGCGDPECIAEAAGHE